MRTNPLSRQLWTGVIAAGIVIMPLHAGSGNTPEMRVVEGSGSLQFVSNVTYSHAELTVRHRTGGVVIQKGFKQQDQLTYDLLASDGSALSDGKYVYDLRYQRAAGHEAVLSGRFEIRGGLLVSTETIDVDVKQDIIDVPILGDAIVEGSLCASDSTDCLLDLIILESESFDTPGFGAADIKIKDNVPEIWFADTTAEDTDFALTVEDGFFFLRDPDADTTPIVVEGGAPDNSIYVTQPGGVGIGIAATDADIQVTNLDGIQDTVFKLHVLGQGSWNIGMTTTGLFAFNKSGTGDREFTVRELDHPVATLDVHGHVRGTSFKSSSSRALKTAFEPVNSADVLASVVELPIMAWRYKSEPESVRHVGPVAEDFREVFELGDGKTIASVDANGIVLAAIQGLEQAFAASEAEVAALKRANADLEQRLAALEAEVDR